MFLNDMHKQAPMISRLHRTQLACLRTSFGILSRRFSIERIMFPCPQISTVFPAMIRGTRRSLQNSHDRAWASLSDSVFGLPHQEAGISSGTATWHRPVRGGNSAVYKRTGNRYAILLFCCFPPFHERK